MTAAEKQLTLDDLASRGLIDARTAVRARDLLRAGEAQEAHAPWFLRALQVVGAWLAAIFFIGFLGAADLLDNGGFSMCLGAVFIAGAATFSSAPRGLFVEQALTALSIAGHIILIANIIEEFDAWIGAVVAFLLLPLTYRYFNSSIHRIFSIHLAVFTLFFVAMAEGHPDWTHLAVALTAGGVLVFYSGQFAAPIWKPAASSSATSLLTALILMLAFGDEANHYRGGGGYHEWVSAVLVAAILPLLPFHLQRHHPASRLPLIAGALLLGAVSIFTAPAIAAALWIFVVAHLRGDRGLSWIAAIAFAIALSVFYYKLDVSLLAKSVSLMALGASFIIARLLVEYLAPHPNSATP
ncbi:MAG: DUF4401 domain-containing protein [Verrucomicrobiales bacterium]